ncbi:MAG: hypothetical protein EA406_12735 [Rhodospirillales bacterium]|nr:MAG: hypothetical protein EA406_12735 [Rhodospirillales bacterium]
MAIGAELAGVARSPVSGRVSGVRRLARGVAGAGGVRHHAVAAAASGAGAGRRAGVAAVAGAAAVPRPAPGLAQPSRQAAPAPSLIRPG